jgi:hypothetical protein
MGYVILKSSKTAKIAKNPPDIIKSINIANKEEFDRHSAFFYSLVRKQ